VYGCEFPPYRLPKYLPIRIFSLEYIKKMVNSDDIHFFQSKINNNSESSASHCKRMKKVVCLDLLGEGGSSDLRRFQVLCGEGF
jgi:hypothetical protein